MNPKLRLHEAFQPGAPGRMPELAQGLGFDLADAFPGHVEILSNLLQGMIFSIQQSETHF